MIATDGASEPGPPPVLFAILDAARALPPDQRRGPFRGVGGSNDRGEDGLWLTVGGRELFLSDDEAGALIAGDWIDVAAVGAGDGVVRLLERGVDADRDR